MKQTHYIGTLDLRAGFVDITDPGYCRHDLMRRNELGVLPGVYRCYTVQEDYSLAGGHQMFRDAAAFIVHESIKADPEIFRESID